MKGFRLLHNFPLSQAYPGAMRSTGSYYLDLPGLIQAKRAAGRERISRRWMNWRACSTPERREAIRLVPPLSQGKGRANRIEALSQGGGQPAAPEQQRHHGD